MERQRDESPMLFHDELSQESQNANSNDEDESLPDVKLSRERFLVIICILFFELFERLTFYGVAANLVFYCKDVLKLASPLASTIALAFQGKFTLITRFLSTLGQMGMCDIILITITNKRGHRLGKQSFYYAKTLAPDNPGEAGGMLSLTRSLKNELPDTKYSIKKAFFLIF